MTSNYLRALEKAKEENGGVLPSDLYLQTNEQLSRLLYDLTGKMPPPRTSKKILIARVERSTNASHMATASSKKRSLDELGDVDLAGGNKKLAIAPKKAPRGCLSSLSAGQVAELKRFLNTSVDRLSIYTHRELQPMWTRIGMTSRYPHMTGKATVINKMQVFAQNNLEFHCS